MRDRVESVSDSASLAILTALAREAREQVSPPPPAALDAQWSEVTTRITRQRFRRGLFFRFSLMGIAASAAGAVWMLLGLSRPSDPAAETAALSYHVEGGTVVEGGYLRESGPEEIKLRFMEGTEVVLTPGTRARLRTVDGSGARIAIENGTTFFNVTHRPAAKWQVDVGPFLVTVKGTIFTVSWDAVSEHFDLKLDRGEVSVAGPISTGEIAVKAGQRLVVDLPKKETVITEEDDGGGLGAGGVPSAGSLGPSEAPAVERPESSTSRPPGRAASLGRPRRAGDGQALSAQGWAEAVAAGQWDRILTEADRAGLRHTLAHASSDDLLALADAARYRRRTGLARSALLAERHRFPGSPSARDAAFLLGRLAESRQGEIGEAVKWYDAYLAGAPAGTYASEALGRKMMATKQLHGSSAANSLARDYLRRFPAGPYAGAAHALLTHP